MKSHFNFNRQQRSGIFFLLTVLVVLQLGYFGLKYYHASSSVSLFELDVENQKKFDSLVLVANTSEKVSQRLFNPNYISDFKGYTLGMSPVQMDRLHQFRAQDKFVNSTEEFQKVTGVSDSLLNTFSPFFKFPDWAKNMEKATKVNPKKQSIEKVKDLNLVSANDLKRIRGIGEKLSARIIKFRDGLGGFLVNEQLYDVYGLEPEVVQRTLQHFQVLDPPDIKKININTADEDELTSLIYLRYNVAKSIVMYRKENGAFTSKDDLFNVPEFPMNKIDRIALYLSY